jgi:hypothetical protein
MAPRQLVPRRFFIVMACDGKTRRGKNLHFRTRGRRLFVDISISFVE